MLPPSTLRLPALLLAALAVPALAQPDPALTATVDQFRDDLAGVTAFVATAALVHDATGAYPTTPYGLLGSAQAGRTALRSAALSDLTVDADGDQLVLRYVPLPTAPYVREDRVVHVTVSRKADGTYAGDYEIVRRADPDQGGRALPYDRAGRYLVERGYGTTCVDPATVRERLAAGTFSPEPGTLGPTPLTVRVHPTGQAEPVYYEEFYEDVR